jgi:hypothetical protein
VCIFSQTDLVYNNVSVEGYSVKIIVWNGGFFTFFTQLQDDRNVI